MQSIANIYHCLGGRARGLEPNLKFQKLRGKQVFTARAVSHSAMPSRDLRIIGVQLAEIGYGRVPPAKARSRRNPATSKRETADT